METCFTKYHIFFPARSDKNLEVIVFYCHKQKLYMVKTVSFSNNLLVSCCIFHAMQNDHGNFQRHLPK